MCFAKTLVVFIKILPGQVLKRRSNISFILDFVTSNRSLRYYSPTGLSRPDWSHHPQLGRDWPKNVYSPVRGSRSWSTPALCLTSVNITIKLDEFFGNRNVSS